MAKRQRNNQVTAAFNYLVKSVEDANQPDGVGEVGFTQAEFLTLVARLRDTTPLDDNDDNVIADIKFGRELPFNHYEEVEPGLYFGDFEGAYYGQKYRNSRLGIIDAESLNLRGFHYLITRLRDGKVLIGTTYHGLFGDYTGLRLCASHYLRGDHRVVSKTLKNPSAEIGDGHPISVKLTYRKQNDRAERAPIFGHSGVLAVSSASFGDDFEQGITSVAAQVHGTVEQRKRALANIVNQGELLTLNEDDIIDCSAVIRENGRTRTIYFLGDNSFSTKFWLNVGVDQHGVADRDQTKREMIRVMRERIIPLLA